MKKIKILSFLLVSVLVFSACEDMLEEVQKGVYSEDTFFDTKENAISSLLAVYAPHKNIEYAQRFQMNIMDLPTNQYNTYGKYVESVFYKMDISPINEDLTYFFKYIYLCINRANNVIENVSQMSPKIISVPERDHIVGEAYFLRAYHHFMAVRTFGEVPIHDRQVKSPGQGRNTYASIQEVYEFIINDLKKAVSMMGIQKIQGRADLVAAQALMGKVYLTMASSKMTGAPGYDWVEDSEAMYAKAAEYSSMVINDQTTYALEPDLSKVYNVDYEDSPEHIWISHATDLHDRYNFPMMFANGIKNKYIPTKLGKPVTAATDVELYIGEGQTGWNYYTVDSLFYKSYDDQDLRKQLMLTTIYDEKGQIIVEWSPNNLNSSDEAERTFYFPMCRKYTDKDAPDFNTSAEMYFMRFAEVLLTYAEAVGPTTEGYAAINAVRKRAKLPNLTAGLSVSEFRQKVWEELTFELAFEGHGMLELRRTNRVMEAITKEETRRDLLEKYAYFYPIPQRESDLNPQN